MTPKYDLTKLPTIQHPFTSKQEITKKYLGKRAITGQEYATIELFAIDNAKTKALYDFWKDDCNYGTKQFLAPIPIFGIEYMKDYPNVLCEFIENISSKKSSIFWVQTIKVKIIEYSEVLGYVIDDNSNQIVDDSGNSIFYDTNYKTNSKKEIIYG